ncbi:ICMT-domain-containing protein [Trametes coccinea BRFM310]|uniref:Protein-S-isoprenylcysteine O-methyltransferase n=1 Tax=Trametes coccinea (strain BRFM310) TaxID=1353009 RepID=A0A1Y2IGK6_TRAC3|nr:ICMT-domain-containing protein [Trametes coccinea BRFM310]
MSFVLSPTLSTPLLKVPLLLAHAVCTYHGMTPPRPLPPPEEQQRFENPDFASRTMNVQVILITASKWACCGFALAEAAAITAQRFPSTTSDWVLSLLLPSTGASLRFTPLSTAACALGIAGGLIRVWCHRTLGQYFTWSVSVQREHKLVTSGPYAIVRHPSYTAWTAMILGNFALLLTEGSYFVEAGWLRRPFGKVLASAIVSYLSFVTVQLISRVPREDAVLRKQFGAEWKQWSRRTPYRLIPYIY